MNTLLPQLAAGLATGGIYASLALALVMVYRSTHHVNFAQGEMAMFCTFIASLLIEAGWPYWAAFLATVAIAFALGAAIEAVLIRRLRHAPVRSARSPARFRKPARPADSSPPISSAPSA
jgi:branched-chain amino acid transport system permease protein